jgi:hypothetical protein
MLGSSDAKFYLNFTLKFNRKSKPTTTEFKITGATGRYESILWPRIFAPAQAKACGYILKVKS